MKDYITMATEERLRVSECKAKLDWALPSVSRFERSSRLAAGAGKLSPPKPRRRERNSSDHIRHARSRRRGFACRIRACTAVAGMFGTTGCARQE